MQEWCLGWNVGWKLACAGCRTGACTTDGRANLTPHPRGQQDLGDTDYKLRLCADMQGFSLHAAVRCGADDRWALEQLGRYITRPALANEHVQTNAVGQVAQKLKTPWPDGTTHLVMSPLEYVQRHIVRQLCGIELCERYVS